VMKDKPVTYCRVCDEPVFTGEQVAYIRIDGIITPICSGCLDDAYENIEVAINEGYDDYN
jgi:alkyl hydroperoxide reductase subunit AhpF